MRAMTHSDSMFSANNVKIAHLLGVQTRVYIGLAHVPAYARNLMYSGCRVERPNLFRSHSTDSITMITPSRTF